jgi:hypothetical protein
LRGTVNPVFVILLEGGPLDDVEHYAKVLLERVKAKVGHLYPIGPDGKETIAYYWARTATYSNPACGAEVPLLRGLNLVKKSGKNASLTPKIDGKI